MNIEELKKIKMTSFELKDLSQTLLAALVYTCADANNPDNLVTLAEIVAEKSKNLFSELNP